MRSNRFAPPSHPILYARTSSYHPVSVCLYDLRTAADRALRDCPECHHSLRWSQQIESGDIHKRDDDECYGLGRLVHVDPYEEKELSNDTGGHNRHASEQRDSSNVSREDDRGT
jgi:hypothetical protein